MDDPDFSLGDEQQAEEILEEVLMSVGADCDAELFIAECAERGLHIGYFLQSVEH